MKTKIAVLALIAVTAGVFTYNRTQRALPSDLRDAVGDVSESKDFDTNIPVVEKANVDFPAPNASQSARTAINVSGEKKLVETARNLVDCITTGKIYLNAPSMPIDENGCIMTKTSGGEDVCISFQADSHYFKAFIGIAPTQSLEQAYNLMWGPNALISRMFRTSARMDVALDSLPRQMNLVVNYRDYNISLGCFPKSGKNTQ